MRLTIELIQKAIVFLKGKVIHTPLEYSPALSELLHTPVYLKLESLQLTGSFKVRGALFYLSTLTEEQKEKGVACCSAGNHGLGVAYAAHFARIPCVVYVPKQADEAKKRKIKKLGATVIESEYHGYDETLAWALTQVRSTQQHFISAFEDELIMAGNGGTIASEIFEDLPDVANVLFPVGGGGLGGGLSYYLKHMNSNIHLIGCQHRDSPALKLSLEQEKAITFMPAIETIAGGLEGGLGARCFDILKNHISETSLITEEEVRNAVCWLLQHHQHLAEPSAVAGLASCLSRKFSLKGKTVILLTGRNVAFSTLQKVIVQHSFADPCNPQTIGTVRKP